MSEIARVEEEANLILTASVIDNQTSGEAVKGVGTILSELKADGKIEDYDGINGNVAVTGIQFDVNSVTLGVGDNSETLIATFLPENTAGGYYVVIKGKKYPVSKVNDKIEIGKTEITTEGSSTRVISDVKSDDEAIATVEKIGNDGIRITGVSEGKATITVKNSESIKTTIEVEIGNFVTVTVQSNDINKGKASALPNSINNKYAEGSTISLTATVSSGYYFDGWYNGTTKLNNAIEYDFTVPSSDTTITAKFLKYGKTVNLGTVTANSVAMESGWQYFYEDAATNGNIYLIYGDYLENAQIPKTANISKNGYRVYSYANRSDLVNYLKGETATYSSTWNEINEAVKAAVKERLIANGTTEANATIVVANITTKGTPTPEQWMSSYNENYGTNLGAENFPSGKRYYNSTSATSVGTSTKTTSYAGYLYTRDNTKTAENIEWETELPVGYMNQQAGYPGNGNSNMYYPHASNSTWNNCPGYWLARSFS